MIRILMTLWLSLTSATLQANEQLVLREKERAPYKGVLVPEKTFKAMFTEIEQKDFLQKALDEKIISYEELQKLSNQRELMFFGAGSLLGVAMILAVRK